MNLDIRSSILIFIDFDDSGMIDGLELIRSLLSYDHYHVTYSINVMSSLFKLYKLSIY